MLPLSVLAGAGFVALASTTAVAAPNDDPLGAYAGRSRVLAVVAPDASDARLAMQRQLVSAMKAGARERDLVVVEGIGASAGARLLRERLGAEASEFRAVLIGKDGGEKLSSATPLDAARLFPLIDSMPMRQEEIRKRSP